jgi:hypothetical protein
MALTTARQADIVYKKQRGLASTSTERAYYEESHVGNRAVLPSQIWAEEAEIPVSPPAGMVNEEIVGVLQRYIDKALTAEPGKNNSFYNTDLRDAIDPKIFGAGYAIEIKDNLDVTIPTGAGNFEIDFDAGVLTFDDSYELDNPPVKISFYKYVGNKGLTSEGTIVYYEFTTGALVAGETATVAHNQNLTSYIIQVRNSTNTNNAVVQTLMPNEADPKNAIDIKSLKAYDAPGLLIQIIGKL